MNINVNIDAYKCSHQVIIDVNIYSDIGCDSKQICAVKLMHNFCTNHHEHQNFFNDCD